ncbi:MAG TPA: NfeD family protein [Actinomycetota bacterium]|nr:NfeD family protein [Actinomycetota bacterium]
MAFVVGTTIAILFLHGVARFGLIAAVAALEIAEIFVWLRWRRVRAITGREGILGMPGIATTDCTPNGQVKVKGHLWSAVSDPPVAAGDAVRVIGVEGLRLTVAPQ